MTIQKSSIKHHTVPGIYADNRGFILTLCGRRVDVKTDIDDNEPTCRNCQEELMRDTEP